jgi:hypothetical protein
MSLLVWRLQLKVGPHQLAARGGKHLREGVLLDALDPLYAWPPARQVMRVCDHAP